MTGEKEIRTWEDVDEDTICIRSDKEATESSISRVRVKLKLPPEENGDALEVIAHDVVWYEKDKGRLFPEVMSFFEHLFYAIYIAIQFAVRQLLYFLGKPSSVC